MTTAKTTGSGAAGSETTVGSYDLSAEATPRSAHRPNALSRVTPQIEKYGLLVLFVLMFFISASFWDRPGTFRSATNLNSVLGTYAVPGMLAVAAIVPLVCGQFDLTVGVGGRAHGHVHSGGPDPLRLPLPVAVLVAQAIGLLVGAVNGYLVAYVGVNAFNFLGSPRSSSRWP